MLPHRRILTPQRLFLQNKLALHWCRYHLIDATASVSAKIYDLSGQLITWVPVCHSLALKQNIESFFDAPMTTYYFDMLGHTIDSAGNFTTKIADHQSALTMITRLIGECDPNGATIIQDITCASVAFSLEPGDLLDTDSHLTGNGFMVGLPVELPAQ